MIAMPSESQSRKNDGHSKAPVLGFAIALAVVFCRPSWLDLDLGKFDEDSALQTISDVRSSSIDADLVAVTPRSLRGGNGSPTTFKWIFPEGPFVVGEPVRTRVLALDARGRPARAASCVLLRVYLNFTGHARLLQQAADLEEWSAGGELRLDINNTVAEAVEAQLHIESSMSSTVSSADALSFSSMMNFVSGPPESFALYVQPTGAPFGKESPKRVNSTSAFWPTDVVLDAVIVGRDRFANLVQMTQNDTRGLGLRSNSASLKVLSFFKAGESGSEARARIKGVSPGRVELWVEHDTRKHGGSLRDDTVQRIEFVGLSREKPRDVIKEANTSGRLSSDDAKWLEIANEVRDEFLHAWKGYREYAWGQDELMPLSKKGKDTFGNIGMTLLDALSTLWMMGLSKEFDDATEWVTASLDFNRANRQVSVFEVVIRALGGLLGAFALSGRPVFLERATDLGERLLLALNTSSGMPLPEWDISKRRGTDQWKETILAEAGSLQLEFRYLTAVSGDARFREAADRSFNAIRGAGASGLVPVHLTPPNEVPTAVKDDNLAMGALADSYYEYLLKQWMQSPSENHFKDMFMEVAQDMQTLVRGDTSASTNSRTENKAKAAKPLRLIEMTSGWREIWKMDHLSCFTPGMLALALQQLPSEELATNERNVTWRRLAEGLGEGCGQMWTKSKTGLAPESMIVDNEAPHKLEVHSDGSHSFVRPETAEALFYLHRLTGNERYRKLGEKMFRAIVEHSKVPGGYASVKDVNKIPTEKMDEMQSFVLAETFKYLFLLFTPSDALDLDKFVLNTEGHPFQRLGPF